MARNILVTGATGTVGSDVLRGLIGRADIQVHAAVRDKNKAAALAGPGVELTLFDYNRPETLAPACGGVDSVFMVSPFTPDGVAQSLALLDAARAAGVKNVVKLLVIRSIQPGGTSTRTFFRRSSTKGWISSQKPSKRVWRLRGRT